MPFAGKELPGPLGAEEVEQVLMASLEYWRVRQGWRHCGPLLEVGK